MSRLTRAFNRTFNRPAHRVTRNANGFTLHRRFLRVFYRPVAAFFPTLDAVYDFVHNETKSGQICIELHPPGDFSSHIHVEFEDAIGRAIRSSGRNTEQTFRAIPPLPRRGPTGPPELLRSSVTGSNRGYNPNLGPGPAPSEDNFPLLVAGAALLAAAVPSDDDKTPAASPLDTNVPLERDSSSCDSSCGGGC
jgi:hypothetical protein